MIASSNNNLLQQTESIKHDIEKEVLQNNNNGFSKEELLTIELDKAIKNNTDINLQFDFLKKKYSGLQEELNNALEAQSKLEKQFYKLEAELDLSKEAELENNKKIREMEVKLTNETKSFEQDKTKFSQREEHLKEQLKNLHNQYKEKLANNSTSPRPTRTRSVSVNFIPSNFGHFNEPEEEDVNNKDPSDRTEASLVHENKVANRTIRQQLKEIGELKGTVKQLNQQAVEQKELYIKQISTLKEEVQQLILSNNKLLEDNESYQFLLQEKTLKGQFSLNQFDSTPNLQPQELFNNPSNSNNSLGANLGTALSNIDSDEEEDSDIKFINSSNQQKDELKFLKDENKALTLYITKILAKIMSNPVLADAITNNADTISTKESKEILPGNSIKSKEVKENKESKDTKSKETTTNKNNISRFSFFSPTFTAQTPPTNLSVTANSANPGRVSFDLPKPNREEHLKPSRNSTDSIDLTREPLTMIREESKQSVKGKENSVRTRRAKSMSVSSINSNLDGEKGENLTSPSIFSFRTAFKRIAVPWKQSNSKLSGSDSEGNNVEVKKENTNNKEKDAPE